MASQACSPSAGTVNPDEDEEEPWLSEVRELVGAAVERGVPFLGVCLGGQLLAQAAGGFVEGAADPTLRTLRVVR